ncbi:hypothetical protein N656DRAFT_147404 [Canariomyces notabilis]|uniref:Uncharacterized protein n=1 Tax=Canariomyces notabilis TaxID=2074819 RepID=A0AAN6TC62_9PEZI|nr:hypothetical protein N656DRAFT_147404 [Canariomyces arenarius]
MDAPDCSAWLYICCNCGSYSDCTALGRLHVRCLACNRVMLGCSICRRDWSHWNQAYCGGNHLRDSVVAVHSSLRQFYTPSTCGIKCWEVPGTINGVPVNALPDWGSSVNAISEDFARRHGIEVEPAAKISITLPGGNAAESTGLAVGQFKFRGESIVYRRNFRVLKKCVYDVGVGPGIP